MACDTRLRSGQTLAQRIDQVKASLKRLEQYLATGSVRVVIAPNGAVTFAGWSTAERDDLSDVCAYRTLAHENSYVLRQAVMRAEAMSGRKVNPQAVAAGFHSHDHGRTWGTH